MMHNDGKTFLMLVWGIMIVIVRADRNDTTVTMETVKDGFPTCDGQVRNLIIVSVVLGFLVIVLIVYSGYLTILMRRIKEKSPSQIGNTPVYIYELGRNGLESAERHIYDNFVSNAPRSENVVSHPPGHSYEPLSELTRQTVTDYSELS